MAPGVIVICPKLSSFSRKVRWCIPLAPLRYAKGGDSSLRFGMTGPAWEARSPLATLRYAKEEIPRCASE